MPWTVRFFTESDGSIPQRQFLDELAKDHRALLAVLLGKIKATAEVRGRIGSHIFKALHKPYSGLFEIRAKSGTELARSLCCRDGEDLILLNGVRKRETPEADLRQAQQLSKLYFATRKTEPPFEKD